MRASVQDIHPVLMASDVSDSILFYRRLGFTVSFQNDPNKPTYAAVRRDDIELHIQWADASQWAYPTDRPAYRFLVNDVELFYSEAMQAGLVNETTSDRSPWSIPANTPWGTLEFHLRDPGKNSLQFYRPL